MNNLRELLDKNIDEAAFEEAFDVYIRLACPDIFHALSEEAFKRHFNAFRGGYVSATIALNGEQE